MKILKNVTPQPIHFGTGISTFKMAAKFEILSLYRNDRYSKESEYDWLGDYKSFKDLIHKHVKKQDRILMVGCGNSKLSQQMFEDGFTNILSTDISEVCIGESYTQSFFKFLKNIRDTLVFLTKNKGQFEIC